VFFLKTTEKPENIFSGFVCIVYFGKTLEKHENLVSGLGFQVFCMKNLIET